MFRALARAFKRRQLRRQGERMAPVFVDPWHVGELRSPRGSGDVGAAVTVEDLSALTRLADSGQIAEIAQMQREQRVWTIARGTRCQVVPGTPDIVPLDGRSLIVAQVRLLDGPDAGRFCWVGAEFIR